MASPEHGVGQDGCGPQCPGACFNGRCLFGGLGIEDASEFSQRQWDSGPGQPLASGEGQHIALSMPDSPWENSGRAPGHFVPSPAWNVGPFAPPGAAMETGALLEVESRPEQQLVPQRVRASVAMPTQRPVAALVAATPWSAMTHAGESLQGRRGPPVDLVTLSPASFKTTSPASSVAVPELGGPFVVEAQLAESLQPSGDFSQQERIVAAQPHSGTILDALQVAEAKAARLALDNARLRKQLNIWHRAGKRIVEREADVVHLLESRHAEPRDEDVGTVEMEDVSGMPSEFPSLAAVGGGGDSGSDSDSGPGSRRRRRAMSAGGQLTAVQLLEQHSLQQTEFVGGHSEQADPLTMVNNLRAYAEHSPRLASGTLAAVLIVATLTSVACAAQLMGWVLRPDQSCKMVTGIGATSRVGRNLGGEGALGKLLRCVGLASKQGGIVEVAELQLGNFDEVLVNGSLRIVIKPGNDAQSERSRAGISIDPSGSPAHNWNGNSCFLAFSDEFIFDVHQSDNLWVFSIFDCDALMDDRIASASVAADDLLRMARQQREYFSLELTVESRRWQRWNSIESVRPFIAMRLIELDLESCKVQARGRRRILKRRATGLPY
mmetsp:Transcript_129759/g.336543  ORF Transcript_129759/g.336543 Transcript_129759/m.336543 type:complete len:608 (+) Transcript_129759:531-2354(+)